MICRGPIRQPATEILPRYSGAGSFDRRLNCYDTLDFIAYARALARPGLITAGP